MCIMNKEINNIVIPSIGFGPDACSYTRFSRSSSNNRVGVMHNLTNFYNKVASRTIDRVMYVKAITNAINNGFKLIDYSASYGSTNLIRKAIDKSDYKREDLLLTTRVSNTAQFNGTIEEEFFNQLKGLNTDYIDILMFHWPVTGKYIETWKKMIKLFNQGYVKILGVANCNQHHLEEIYSETGIYPCINQFERHPLFTQNKLVEFCKSKSIYVQAYTPIARFDGRLVNLPCLKRIAEKYHKSVVQVILRWHIQTGVMPIVRALTSKHQKIDLALFDFSLTENEIDIISSININSRIRFDPDNCDFSIL